jgi:SAM-dependent methyltransferase
MAGGTSVAGALAAGAAVASAPTKPPPAFPDWRFAPNIGGHPQSYEIENRAVDRAGHVLAAMRAIAPWDGKVIVDLGCGTGFWLTRYAATAARVIGVEPDPALRAAARRATGDGVSHRATGDGVNRRPTGDRGSVRPATGDRAAPDLGAAQVLAGSAEHLPLPDHSVDVVHARFAYFFPPGAEAGLAEVLRVLRPGGQLIVVDNDYRWGEFASLLAASATRPPLETAATVDAWWRDRGAARYEVRSELRFASRTDLAAVLHIEFPAEVANAWLRRHPAATGLSYGYVLFAVRG